MAERLRNWADERGYAIAWGPAETVSEVQGRIVQRHDEGSLEQRFYDDVVDWITKPQDRLAGTVVVIAVPRPAHKLTFETADGPFVAIAPPACVGQVTVARGVQAELTTLLSPATVVPLIKAPRKSLAVRLGMAAYGRNNVTYTALTGSLHQLVTYLIDVSLPAWPGLQDLETMLPRCSGCDACRRSCPTGALGADRYLLHGERCLSYINELTGDWPDWVSADAHSAIIDCMRCIGVCPANTGKLRFEAFEPTFTVAETEAILAGRPGGNEPAWQSVIDKLVAADFAELIDPLSRNLRALMAMSGR